jgi:RNA polymerase sigma-70 factor (ECF subfamily)
MRPSPVDDINNPDVATAGSGNPGTDEELVAAAKSGDELAFEMLIKRYQSRVFALALRYTRIHEDAEDIVQQTFQKAFVYLQKFQGKSAFATWLTRIAINESLMLLRRGRASREVSFIDSCSEDATSRGLEILDSSPNLEMSYLQQEAVDILFSAMTQLRPGLRIAMELKELGSYPVGIRLGTWASQSALLKPAYSMDEESYGKY